MGGLAARLDRMFADGATTRRQLRAGGLGIAIMLGVWAAIGGLAPVTYRVVTFDELGGSSNPLGLVALLVGLLATMAGSWSLAFAIVFRRLPTLRELRSHPKRRWIRPDLPALVVMMLVGQRLPTETVSASGLHWMHDNPPTFLEVVTLADLAYAMIVSFVVWVAVYVTATLLLLPVHAAVLRREARTPPREPPILGRPLTPAETWPPGADWAGN